MAVTAAVEAIISRSLNAFLAGRRASQIAMGRNPAHVASAFEMAEYVRGKFGDRPGLTPQNLRAIGQRTLANFEQGMRMNEQRDALPLRDAVRGDAAIQPGEQRFRYSVLVTRVDEAGDTFTYLSEVRSDSLLSANQVEAIIQERASDEQYMKRKSILAARQQGAIESVSARILSVGART